MKTQPNNKKPRTFNQRWNKTALKRIKRAYKSNTSLAYLCEVPEFKALWNDHSDSIRKLAIAFDSRARVPAICFGSCLFYDEPQRTIRLDFLQHEINRLTQP